MDIESRAVKYDGDTRYTLKSLRMIKCHPEQLVPFLGQTTSMKNIIPYFMNASDSSSRGSEFKMEGEGFKTRQGEKVFGKAKMKLEGERM